MIIDTKHICSTLNTIYLIVLLISMIFSDKIINSSIITNASNRTKYYVILDNN